MTRDTTGATLVRARWEIRRQPGVPPLSGDLRALPGPPPRSAVVICHGFKGFREWGFFPSLARAVARRGHAAITFDFSHNGVGEDGVDFSALDRFAENTHTVNVEEILQVVDAVEGKGIFPARPQRIALLGHSRGGAEAILAAGRDPRVNALVTWAAIASIEGRWNEEQIATWNR
ncbi:MAG TPA: alpha/beta fold hydrolase, partial [Longimicrobiaceae bacterium]|nr:alpha/beta fold hydrolase [Longimicrobiaceae bacterium]